MSVLYSENGCTLISHKDYIDSTLLNTRENSVTDVKQQTFVLRKEVFDYNSDKSPDQNDDNENRRHRKINTKKTNISIERNPELHKLVR